MKIFKANEGCILVNRETGGAGSAVYAPDTVDDYLWAQIPIAEYNKWNNKDNREKIVNEIKEQLKAAMIVEQVETMSIDSNGSSPVEDGEKEDNIILQDIDPTKVNIVLSDNVYTFKQMFASINSTLCNNVDVTDNILKDIYDEIKNS